MAREAKKIAVIGDGGWGTTLAILLCNKGHDVWLWGAFPEYVESLKKSRENIKFLPGVSIPAKISITGSINDALSEAGVVVLAVPSQFTRSVLKKMAASGLSGSIMVSVTKGIEIDTLKRMSEVVAEEFGERRFAVLSGPTIAHEVAGCIPTTAVCASYEQDDATSVQEIFFTDRFRVYTSTDVTGVELGGSLKNVIAIAAGISDGLGFGTNAKAALLTRGLTEIIRLGCAAGARRETFFGLSGLGDLATTCMSRHSRNRWLGEEIGKGKKLGEALQGTEMVVEGISTTRSAYELSKKYSIEMPITGEIYKILYKGKDPAKAVNDLMTRAPKREE
ncbi:MAG: NAD(P)H-dependent glycerol-3-phosphate dehydrogenase [Candidatus Omnitrophota bacterium]